MSIDFNCDIVEQAVVFLSVDHAHVDSEEEEMFTQTLVIDKSVKVVPASPRPPRETPWRFTDAGKNLNWNRRSKSAALVQVLTHKELIKQAACGDCEKFVALSKIKTNQLKKVMNPHKEEWPEVSTECSVRGRRLCHVKRLRWEAEPKEGPERKRRRCLDAPGVWVMEA